MISQNFWLTVAGVLLGLPGGFAALYWLIQALVTEYELKVFVGVLTYAVSILLTFGISLAAGWMVAGKNRKINMAGALKSRKSLRRNGYERASFLSAQHTAEA